MGHDLTRRTFFGLVPLAAMPSLAVGEQKTATEVADNFPKHDLAKVQAVVGASHFDLDKVKELLKQTPALVNATWDLGFGDWETPIGAASHVGRRDIATYLLENGARPDIFTYVMLGNLAVVKAAIGAQPGLQRTKGPHGITMLSHAKNGGEEAKEVYAYLESLGDADLRPKTIPITDEEKKLYLGRFEFGPGKYDAFEITLNKQGDLSMKRGETFVRGIQRVEEHVFIPTGIESVKIRFTVEKGQAVALAVSDPSPLVTARKA